MSSFSSQPERNFAPRTPVVKPKIEFRGATGATLPVSLQQSLYRGCSLRKAFWVVGVCVATGHETKIMKNSRNPPSKHSRLEKMINFLLLAVLGLQLMLTIAATIAVSVIPFDSWYFKEPVRDQNSPTFERFKAFLTFLILFNNFIPISLYVSIEFIKFGQGRLMEQDLCMYYAPKDMPAAAKTTDLNEELGQINFVFCDKTGTLTRNVMALLKFAVNGTIYGEGTTEIGRVAALRKGIELDDPRPQSVIQSPDPFWDRRLGEKWFLDRNVTKIRELFMALGVCHTVVVDGKKLEAESPDDEALVKAAARFDYELVHRSLDAVKLQAKNSGTTTITICETLQFSSLRKRMSVVIRDPVTDHYVLVTKGADTVMIPRMSKAPGVNNPRQAQVILDKFAEEGLRTLVVCSRTLDTAYAEDWLGRMRVAREMIGQEKERDRIIDDLAEEIEKELVLIGVTGVEDKLQDRVSQTISSLRTAGMNVWMLTGDKRETATNIGFACALLHGDMKLIDLHDYKKNAGPVLLSKLKEAVKKKLAAEEAHKKKMEAMMKEDTKGYRFGDNDNNNKNSTSNQQQHQQLNPNNNNGSSQTLNSQSVLLTSPISATGATGATPTTPGAPFTVTRHNKPSSSSTNNKQQQKPSSSATPSSATSSEELGQAAPPAPPSALKRSFLANDKGQEFACIIDGGTLAIALSTPDLKQAFYDLVSRCSSVICCRVSPKQKADVVTLMREYSGDTITTLAIGDGANDVPMIQAAHVGVGISGMEGQQAANSADFAIGQFKHLHRLLLVHGFANYSRLSTVIKYSFYKNALLVMTLFYFLIYNKFTGQSLYEEWSFASYNVVFTFFPIVVVGIFDREIFNTDRFHEYPQLYQTGINSAHLNTPIMVYWLMAAVLQGLAIFFVVVVSPGDCIGKNGQPLSLDGQGVTAYGAVVLIATLQLSLMIHSYSNLQYTALGGSLLAFFTFLAVYSVFPPTVSTTLYGILVNAAFEQIMWLLAILALLIALMPTILVSYVQRALVPVEKLPLSEIVQLADQDNSQASVMQPREMFEEDYSAETGDAAQRLSEADKFRHQNLTFLLSGTKSRPGQQVINDEQDWLLRFVDDSVEEAFNDIYIGDMFRYRVGFAICSVAAIAVAINFARQIGEVNIVEVAGWIIFAIAALSGFVVIQFFPESKSQLNELMIMLMTIAFSGASIANLIATQADRQTHPVTLAVILLGLLVLVRPVLLQAIAYMIIVICVYFMWSLIWIQGWSSRDESIRAAELLIVGVTSIIGLAMSENFQRKMFISRLAITQALQRAKNEQKRSLLLLQNVMPASIVADLRGKTLGQFSLSFERASIVTSDVVRFTAFSALHESHVVVEMLNIMFVMFDAHASELGIEKIKTIGDAYMCASGIPNVDADHCTKIMVMGLWMLRSVALMCREGTPSIRKLDISIRVGAATGMVRAGVVGRQKLCYDVFGEAVQEAVKMESSSRPRRLRVSADLYESVKDQFNFDVITTPADDFAGTPEETAYYAYDDKKDKKWLHSKTAATNITKGGSRKRRRAAYRRVDTREDQYQFLTRGSSSSSSPQSFLQVYKLDEGKMSICTLNFESELIETDFRKYLSTLADSRTNTERIQAFALFLLCSFLLALHLRTFLNWLVILLFACAWLSLLSIFIARAEVSQLEETMKNTNGLDDIIEQQGGKQASSNNHNNNMNNNNNQFSGGKYYPNVHQGGGDGGGHYRNHNNNDDNVSSEAFNMSVGANNSTSNNNTLNAAAATALLNNNNHHRGSVYTNNSDDRGSNTTNTNAIAGISRDTARGSAAQFMEAVQSKNNNNNNKRRSSSGAAVINGWAGSIVSSGAGGGGEHTPPTATSGDDQQGSASQSSGGASQLYPASGSYYYQHNPGSGPSSLGNSMNRMNRPHQQQPGSGGNSNNNTTSNPQSPTSGNPQQQQQQQQHDNFGVLSVNVPLRREGTEVMLMNASAAAASQNNPQLLKSSMNANKTGKIHSNGGDEQVDKFFAADDDENEQQQQEQPQQSIEHGSGTGTTIVTSTDNQNSVNVIEITKSSQEVSKLQFSTIELAANSGNKNSNNNNNNSNKKDVNTSVLNGNASNNNKNDRSPPMIPQNNSPHHHPATSNAPNRQNQKQQQHHYGANASGTYDYNQDPEIKWVASYSESSPESLALARKQTSNLSAYKTPGSKNNNTTDINSQTHQNQNPFYNHQSNNHNSTNDNSENKSNDAAFGQIVPSSPLRTTTTTTKSSATAGTAVTDDLNNTNNGAASFDMKNHSNRRGTIAQATDKSAVRNEGLTAQQEQQQKNHPPGHYFDDSTPLPSKVPSPLLPHQVESADNENQDQQRGQTFDDQNRNEHQQNDNRNYFDENSEQQQQHQRGLVTVVQTSAHNSVAEAAGLGAKRRSVVQLISPTQDNLSYQQQQQQRRSAGSYNDSTNTHLFKNSTSEYPPAHHMTSELASSTHSPHYGRSGQGTAPPSQHASVTQYPVLNGSVMLNHNNNNNNNQNNHNNNAVMIGSKQSSSSTSNSKEILQNSNPHHNGTGFTPPNGNSSGQVSPTTDQLLLQQRQAGSRSHSDTTNHSGSTSQQQHSQYHHQDASAQNRFSQSGNPSGASSASGSPSQSAIQNSHHHHHHHHPNNAVFGSFTSQQQQQQHQHSGGGVKTNRQITSGGGAAALTGTEAARLFEQQQRQQNRDLLDVADDDNNGDGQNQLMSNNGSFGASRTSMRTAGGQGMLNSTTSQPQWNRSFGNMMGASVVNNQSFGVGGAPGVSVSLHPDDKKKRIQQIEEDFRNNMKDRGDTCCSCHNVECNYRLALLFGSVCTGMLALATPVLFVSFQIGSEEITIALFLCLAAIVNVNGSFRLRLWIKVMIAVVHFIIFIALAVRSALMQSIADGDSADGIGNLDSGNLVALVLCYAISIYAGYTTEVSVRANFSASMRVQIENNQVQSAIDLCERLLCNVLPVTIIERMRKNPSKRIVDEVDDASVLFLYIDGLKPDDVAAHDEVEEDNGRTNNNNTRKNSGTGKQQHQQNNHMILKAQATVAEYTRANDENDDDNDQQIGDGSGGGDGEENNNDTSGEQRKKRQSSPPNSSDSHNTMKPPASAAKSPAHDAPLFPIDNTEDLDDNTHTNINIANHQALTHLHPRVSTQQMIHEMNDFVFVVDLLCQYHRVEKIKTVPFLIASGCPTPCTNHFLRLSTLARDVIVFAENYNKRTGKDVRVKAGLHTGKVSAGVLGSIKFIYDVFGDTVNFASRLASVCRPGNLTVSDGTADRLVDYINTICDGTVHLKGKGDQRIHHAEFESLQHMPPPPFVVDLDITMEEAQDWVEGSADPHYFTEKPMEQEDAINSGTLEMMEGRASMGTNHAGYSPKNSAVGLGSGNNNNNNNNIGNFKKPNTTTATHHHNKFDNAAEEFWMQQGNTSPQLGRSRANSTRSQAQPQQYQRQQQNSSPPTNTSRNNSPTTLLLNHQRKKTSFVVPSTALRTSGGSLPTSEQHQYQHPHQHQHEKQQEGVAVSLDQSASSTRSGRLVVENASQDGLDQASSLDTATIIIVNNNNNDGTAAADPRQQQQKQLKVNARSINNNTTDYNSNNIVPKDAVVMESYRSDSSGASHNHNNINSSLHNDSNVVDLDGVDHHQLGVGGGMFSGGGGQASAYQALIGGLKTERAEQQTSLGLSNGSPSGERKPKASPY